MKLRRLLFPFSLIYGFVAEIRNICYSLNIFKTFKASCKVISVGNLCAGGTGKTPFVIALIEHLSPKFKHIVVISRGYGRKSKGSKIVSLQGNILTSIDESGDEPYIIAKRFSSISVVVAEKRVLGYKLILNKCNTNPDLVILDDGFQHQSFERDLNICLMNGFEPYSNDLVIPAGNLREFKRNLKRADVLIRTKTDGTYTFKNIPSFFVPYKMYKLNKKVDHEQKTILVSGIAKPKHFERFIEELGFPYQIHKIYKDHYNYTKNDFNNLSPDSQIITTEKDYYKLETLNLPNPIMYLKIDFDLTNDIRKFIDETILI